MFLKYIQVGLMPRVGRVGRVTYRCACSQHRSSVTLSSASQNVDNLDYIKAKPFSEIPGPKGLPYLGTLFQYTRGKFGRCANAYIIVRDRVKNAPT